MASNSKPAAERRIGAVKATVLENEVGGITHHNVTVSRLYRDEGQWKRAPKASASTTCSPSLSSPTRRTRLLPSATPERPARPMMPELRKTFAPFGGGFTPVAFFADMRARERTARGSETTTAQDVSTGTLLWGGLRKSSAAQSEMGFSLKPWKFPDALEILETLAIPCAPGSVHEIHSFPLISQRRICVSIRLRRLYHFRRRQDRESALRQASDADSTKIRGVR